MPPTSVRSNQGSGSASNEMPDEADDKSLSREHEDVTSTVDGGGDSVGAPARVTLRELRRARNLRRLVLLILAAFLVLGALNFFGGRRTQTQATAGGYQLQVSYPTTGRPGIGAPIQIQVQHQNGFTGPVTLSMSSDYLDVFSVRSMDPQPSQETTTDKMVIWQFDQPPGDMLTVSFDSQFQPDEHPGPHTARVAVLENGQPAAQVRLRTWEAP